MDLNLYELIRSYKTEIPECRVKHIVFQMLLALDHMHRNGIFHRDIKPENVLVNDDIVKLADFGSCRGIYSLQPYTEYISTRWYRPPECLLTDGYYSAKMDMWGVGCVFYELLTLNPLFPGDNEIDQINLIHKVVGTPPIEVLNSFKELTTTVELNFKQVKGSGIDSLLPSHVSVQARDLMKALLIYKAEDRISCEMALKHKYFKEYRTEKQRRSSPSPYSIRSFDIGRIEPEEPKKLPVLKNSTKKPLEMQHNSSKEALGFKPNLLGKEKPQELKNGFARKKQFHKSIF